MPASTANAPSGGRLHRLLTSLSPAPAAKPSVRPQAATLIEPATAPAAPELSGRAPVPRAGGPPIEHPVLDLLRQRLREGSRPGQRNDGFKLGLAVEGGGMRGIVTGAMLMGLLGFDALEAFDAVYGASAGAINATYFLTGQPEGLDIYTEHLATSDRFLSLKRYWMGGPAPAMDLSFLLDEVMVGVTPLDWHGVIESPVPLKVVASSLDSLRAELLQDFTCPRDLKESLKASALVPVISGPPREHRGHRFVDAAVFEPIPVKSAVRDGCTHVMALCSRPASSGPAWGKVVKRTLTGAVKHFVLSPPYMKEAWRVEPQHATHQGRPLDELLLSMAGGTGETLDLSDEEPYYSGQAGRGSPVASTSGSMDGAADPSVGDVAARAARRAASDMAGCGAAAGVRAADGVGGSHILPVYPSGAAAFAPVCTHVPTLKKGRQEGFEAVQRVLLPALLPKARG